MSRALIDLVAQYGDARERGDTKAGELYGELRDALALKADELPVTDRLTERKTREILRDRPYTLTGYVARSADGQAFIISSSAVRWLNASAFNAVMFPPQDLAAATASDSAADAPEVEQPVGYTSQYDLDRLQSGRKIGSIWMHEAFRDPTDIALYTRPGKRNAG